MLVLLILFDAFLSDRFPTRWWVHFPKITFVVPGVVFKTQVGKSGNRLVEVSLIHGLCKEASSLRCFFFDASLLSCSNERSKVEQWHGSSSLHRLRLGRGNNTIGKELVDLILGRTEEIDELH